MSVYMLYVCCIYSLAWVLTSLNVVVFYTIQYTGRYPLEVVSLGGWDRVCKYCDLWGFELYTYERNNHDWSSPERYRMLNSIAAASFAGYKAKWKDGVKVK